MTAPDWEFGFGWGTQTRCAHPFQREGITDMATCDPENRQRQPLPRYLESWLDPRSLRFAITEDALPHRPGDSEQGRSGRCLRAQSDLGSVIAAKVVDREPELATELSGSLLTHAQAPSPGVKCHFDFQGKSQIRTGSEPEYGQGQADRVKHTGSGLRLQVSASSGTTPALHRACFGSHVGRPLPDCDSFRCRAPVRCAACSWVCTSGSASRLLPTQ